MLKYLNIEKKEKSLTILEVILALFLLSTGIIASYGLVTSAVIYSNNAPTEFTAFYLAQEGIELVRNIRDTNWLQGTPITWNQGLTGCAGNCDGQTGQGCIADYNVSSDENVDLSANPYSDQFLKYDSNSLYNYTSGTDTKFKRQINVTSPTDPDELEVCVYVEWMERGRTRQIQVRENLYNWH